MQIRSNAQYIYIKAIIYFVRNFFVFLFLSRAVDRVPCVCEKENARPVFFVCVRVCVFVISSKTNDVIYIYSPSTFFCVFVP